MRKEGTLFGCELPLPLDHLYRFDASLLKAFKNNLT
jgi:hypothetical protein